MVVTAPPNVLRRSAATLRAFAWLVGIAAVVIAIFLFAHSTDHGDEHRLRYILVGIGVLVGGFALSALLTGVGRIAIAVEELRDARTAGR